MRWAVILAGGSGTRFWPLSTPSQPKQLLPLTGSTSTAEEAIDRLSGFIPRERVLVVTGPGLAHPLQERLKLPASNVLIEPRAASTAPALIWATAEAQRRDPEAEVLTLHADWAIGDGARMVARFSEKPDAATALDLMAAGALWNSGLFAWTAERLLEEAEAHTPEVAPHLPALRAGNVEQFFRDVTPISIDVGLLERSSSVAVVTGAFAWDDIGTWQALTRVRPKDPNGNVLVGRAYTHNSEDCIVWTERDTVVLSGVQDLIVVQANGRILVMPADHAASMKNLLDAL